LNELNHLLVGAVATASLVVALFFLKFWRATRDRLFLFFALSFAIEGLNRLALYFFVGPNEDAPAYYLLRLLAYGLILAAIIDKNRQRLK
jgi:hypothetical protein